VKKEFLISLQNGASATTFEKNKPIVMIDNALCSENLLLSKPKSADHRNFVT
jgi:hypothetical protein